METNSTILIAQAKQKGIEEKLFLCAAVLWCGIACYEMFFKATPTVENAIFISTCIACAILSAVANETFKIDRMLKCFEKILLSQEQEIEILKKQKEENNI
jgi:hypothetical protein